MIDDRTNAPPGPVDTSPPDSTTTGAADLCSCGRALGWPRYRCADGWRCESCVAVVFNDPLARQVSWCPCCGPEPRCDEDGCCTTCGADVGMVPDADALREALEGERRLHAAAAMRVEAAERRFQELSALFTHDNNAWAERCEQAERERDELVSERRSLRDWKAGATGAATITYPPRVGPHTEDAYCAHKSAYEGGSEDYRIGADVVDVAVLAVKESWAGALPAHDPLTCPCCQEAILGNDE